MPDAARYLLTVTAADAARLESWLGYQLQIAPSGLAGGAGIPIAGLAAVTEEETGGSQS